MSDGRTRVESDFSEPAAEAGLVRANLHLALLPSRRPFFRAVRRVTDRPTVFSGPGVRRVRDRPTDPLPGGCAMTTLAFLVSRKVTVLCFPPQTCKTPRPGFLPPPTPCRNAAARALVAYEQDGSRRYYGTSCHRSTRKHGWGASTEGSRWEARHLSEPQQWARLGLGRVREPTAVREARVCV